VHSDSRLILSIAGTIAVHIILFVTADVVQVYTPKKKHNPAPRIEMIDVEPPAVLQPPPPPVAKEPEPEPPVEPPKPVEPKRVVEARIKTAPVRSVEPPPTDEPPPVTDPSPAGGDQVVTLDAASYGPGGVPVAVGRRTSERVGRGGAGGGTGAGIGSGASAEPPKPVSVATIKKRAMPKGDQSYFDAGKDYPPEARQMGIEGVIRVRLVVDESGKVQNAVLLNKLGHGLDELALERSKLIEFTPAIDTSDQPVSSVVVWTFTMTLPK
jgi:TonB family protein